MSPAQGHTDGKQGGQSYHQWDERTVHDCISLALKKQHGTFVRLYVNYLHVNIINGPK